MSGIDPKLLENPELEAFVDEMIERAKAKGYIPTTFMALREKKRTIMAISILVQQEDVTSGFKRLCELGLVDWSIEAAVEKFPEDFSKPDRVYAEFRLRQARENKPVL